MAKSQRPVVMDKLSSSETRLVINLVTLLSRDFVCPNSNGGCNLCRVRIGAHKIRAHYKFLCSVMSNGEVGNNLDAHSLKILAEFF